MKSKWLALMMAGLLALTMAATSLAEYIIEDSDTRKLAREDLVGLSRAALGYVRAEIAARHGYVFSNETYTDYFSDKDWYVPDASFRIDQLSDIELYNLEMIKRAEALIAEDGASAERHETEDSATSSYFISDSDSRLLTRSELEGYTLGELGFIRNEILARHGYPFKTERYRDYFESCSWYLRDDNFDSSRLNSIEKENVALIQKIEKALS